ncbi:MAG: GNAT family N-acetyltransferase, partial [Anaerolineae bacterium]|nr:GNAT family N-acetyltransferase [Anaerolineae bacterium]
TCEIQRITDPTELDIIEPIWAGVERGQLGVFRDVLARDMAAGITTIHVARVDGVAASMGGTFYAANDFANLWGGATLPDYRRRGLYRTLLASRLVEARDRGKKFLRVDCGPMSRPIVERSGFTCIGMVWTYRYGDDSPHMDE